MELQIHLHGPFLYCSAPSYCENVTANARQVVCQFKLLCCVNVLQCSWMVNDMKMGHVCSVPETISDPIIMECYDSF